MGPALWPMHLPLFHQQDLCVPSFLLFVQQASVEGPPCVVNGTGSTLVQKAHSSCFCWILSFKHYSLPTVQTELRDLDPPSPLLDPSPCQRNIGKCSWQTAGRSHSWMSGQHQNTSRTLLDSQLSWSELPPAALCGYPSCPPHSL